MHKIVNFLGHQFIKQLDHNEKRESKEITLFDRLLQQCYQNVSAYALSELVTKHHLDRGRFDLLVDYGINHCTDILIPGYFYIIQKLSTLEVLFTLIKSAT